MNKVTYTKEGKEIEITSLIPDLTVGTPVIVSLETLQRLTSFLPSASFESIKARILDDIRVSSNMNELVVKLEDEIMFQRSVNLINRAYIVDNTIEFEGDEVDDFNGTDDFEGTAEYEEERSINTI